MKKADVKIGETYTAKVSGKLVPVKLVGTHTYGGWIGINMETNRHVQIKTAARLRSKVLNAAERTQLAKDRVVFLQPALSGAAWCLWGARLNPAKRGARLCLAVSEGA